MGISCELELSYIALIVGSIIRTTSLFKNTSACVDVHTDMKIQFR